MSNASAGLENLWNELASRYSCDKELITTLWREIKESYSAGERYYHNLSHVADLIDKALMYRSQLKDLDTVLFSIFYHDVIYSAQRTDNEEKSAKMASDRLTRLGVPDEKINNCYRQIMATKTHESHQEGDTDYLLDFDLSVLGASLENYRDYTGKIRKEYAVYPDFLYRRGRKKVVRHFLNSKRIFKTSEFYLKYEDQARKNLERELKELGY